jgi:hypothetical protein
MTSKDKQGKHIEQDMANGAGIVNKHIGNKLPYPAKAQNCQGHHGKIQGYRNIPEEPLCHVNEDVYAYDIKHDVIVPVAERTPNDVHNI